MTQGKLIDMTAQVWERLTVIERAPNSPRNTAMWLCQCTCGKQIIVPGGGLRSGNNRSCGCLYLERTREAHVTHGQCSQDYMTPEYRAWRSMRSRCNYEHDKSYVDYGRRGIKVCERWQQKFESFFADMGQKPTPKHSLDRIDNDKNYSCGQCEECIANGWIMNCQWATKKQQRDNQRPRRKRGKTNG